MSVSYKESRNIVARIRESSEIMKRYPNKIPVIVEKARQAVDIPTIDRSKFLCPDDLTLGQFIYVIRKRMTIPPEKALFVFVQNTMPMSSQFMRELYYSHKDVDGFLYMTYAGENTFGE